MLTLCLHSNTSAGAGFRGALEGWARAGIRLVELDAAFVDGFLETDTIAGARQVLADNGLTAVHGAVGVPGLVAPNPGHAGALDALRARLELFASLGVRRVYTTALGERAIARDEYAVVARQLHAVGEAARAFDVECSVEFARSSPFLSTLLTALQVTREAAHPSVGVLFDCYHFWSGLNRFDDLDAVRPCEIRHVHLQDVPAGPRELLDSATRVIPGDGVAPLLPTLRALAAKGYAGPVSVELFLPQFRDGDPFAVAEEIRRKCEPLLAEANAPGGRPVAAAGSGAAASLAR
jgi:sugar phosphate isomerase/epimerase